MKSLSVLPAVLALAFCFFPAQNTQAASLFGKVIEVSDGDVITVSNLNRPVRVRLLGIDAPESKQAFGEIARQHLRDLVFDKFVTVTYSGLGQNSLLVGQVSMNGVDIGAQMIRDGAAWFDPNNKSRLSETDCEVYRQSELAARSERRGLWQTEGAVPPWEFVKNESARPASLASLPPPSTRPENNRPRVELTTESLLGSALTAPASNKDEAGLATAVRKTWQRFQPSGEGFSALVPSGGSQITSPVPFGSRMIDVNYYTARDGSSIYAVMWTTGPSNGETDAAAINGTLLGFLRGVGAGYERVGGKFSCEPQSERDISSSGYQGRAFDLRGCTIPALARAFTKVVGEQRQMYFAAVFYITEDANVTKFMESFTVGGATNLNSRAVPKGNQPQNQER